MANRLRNAIAHRIDGHEVQQAIKNTRKAYAALSAQSAKDEQAMTDVQLALSAFTHCGSFIVVATENKKRGARVGAAKVSQTLMTYGDGLEKPPEENQRLSRESIRLPLHHSPMDFPAKSISYTDIQINRLRRPIDCRPTCAPFYSLAPALGKRGDDRLAGNAPWTVPHPLKRDEIRLGP